jgi:hypothetical protein
MGRGTEAINGMMGIIGQLNFAKFYVASLQKNARMIKITPVVHRTCALIFLIYGEYEVYW